MLSALINALVLMLGSIYIFYERIKCIMNPQMTDAKWVIDIAIHLIVTLNPAEKSSTNKLFRFIL
jgi:Co/Zn/Cd efflux system component